MEGKRRKETKGVEENTLAILDASGFGKKEISVSQHVQNHNDDRMYFYICTLVCCFLVFDVFAIDCLYLCIYFRACFS